MKIPVLAAHESESGNLYVWCWYCGKWHIHGPGEGHRVAHCGDRKSPYAETGYVLKIVGPLPADLARALSKRLKRSDYYFRQIMAARRGKKDESTQVRQSQ